MKIHENRILLNEWHAYISGMHVVCVRVRSSVNLYATYKHAYLYEFSRAEHMSCRLILSKENPSLLWTL